MIKSGKRPIVGSMRRLFRVDDRIASRDSRTGDAVVLYNIDSSQPLMSSPEFLDPDMTKIMIDSGKLSHPRKKASIWSNLDDKFDKYVEIGMFAIIGVIVVYTLLGQVLA